MGSVFPSRREVTIASGGSTSDEIDLSRSGEQVVGIVTPATITGTALTFTVCVAGTTFVPLHVGAGTAYSITVAASRFTHVDPNAFLGVSKLKVVSGAVEAQDTIISIITRPVR